MGYEKINESMNYNFEAKGGEFYNIFFNFVKENSEILDLEETEQFLLPEEAFGDNRKRPGYEKAKQLVEVLKQEKTQNYGRSK